MPALQGSDGQSLTLPWVDAVHFCKASDASRQDPVAIAKSLAYQLSLRFRAVADAVLALDAKQVARLERPEEALRLLVVEPLQALRKQGGRRAVILFDALDEADPPGANSSLSNPVVRLLASLREAQPVLVATTRPVPEHIVETLRGRWKDDFHLKAPGDFLAAAQRQEEQRPAAGGGAAAADDEWARALATNSKSKVFCVVAAALRDRYPESTPPKDVWAAFETAFRLGWPAGEAAGLDLEKTLQLLLAAREPPSVAALESMGVRSVLSSLPLWGVLFQASHSSPLGARAQSRSPRMTAAAHYSSPEASLRRQRGGNILNLLL